MSLPLASNTSLTSIGGGAGAEATDSPAAFFYVLDGQIYRKVTSSTGAGFGYTSPATYDMTITALRTVMMKINCTDFGGLQPTNGMRLRIGSASGSEHEYIAVGSLAKIGLLQKYPAKGGFIIVPIDVNIAAYRQTSGTPTLTAIDWFALVGAFASASAKAENIGFDNIDLGTGLELHTSGNLVDFVAHDEGITTNRFGYAFTQGADNYALFGTMFVGRNAGATSAIIISDSVRETYEHLDGLFQAGWSGWLFDNGNASTDILLENKTFKSSGSEAVEDSRGVFAVVGTAGTIVYNLCNFINQSSITLRAGITISNSLIILCEAITQNGATIVGNTCSDNVNANGEALFTIDDLSLFTINHIEGDGTGYAVDLGTIASSGTITWDNTVNTSNFAATDGSTGNEVIKVNYTDTGADLIISVAAGASIPTIHNIGAGTVDVQAGLITLSVTVLDDSTGLPITDARVHLHKVGATGTVYISKQTDGSGVASEDVPFDAITDLVGWARQMDLTGTDYTPKDFSGQYDSGGFSITIRLEPIT